MSRGTSSGGSSSVSSTTSSHEPHVVFFIAVQRQLWGPTSHGLNVHGGSATGNAPVAQRSTDSRAPGVLNGEPRNVEVPPKPPCATISVLSVSICWGSAPGTPGSSLGLPCRLPQAFLRDSHLPTHLSSAHGSTHRVPPWTIPSPPPDRRTAPHLLLLSHAPGHPFHLSMSGSELSISCWGALGDSTCPPFGSH